MSSFQDTTIFKHSGIEPEETLRLSPGEEQDLTTEAHRCRTYSDFVVCNSRGYTAQMTPNTRSLVASQEAGSIMNEPLSLTVNSQRSGALNYEHLMGHKIDYRELLSEGFCAVDPELEDFMTLDVSSDCFDFSQNGCNPLVKSLFQDHSTTIPPSHYNNTYVEVVGRLFDIWSILYKRNLRLAYAVAGRLSRKWNAPIDKLIPASNYGLWRGIIRYHPGKGAALGTYTSYWMVAEMRVAFKAHKHPVKVSQVHYAEAIRHKSVLKSRMSTTEIADKLGIPESKVIKLRAALTTRFSLQDTLYDDSERTFEEVVSSETPSPYEHLASVEAAAILPKLLELINVHTTDERALDVLRMRFLEQKRRPEIGRSVNSKRGGHLSRQRVEQIELQSLEELRKVPEVQDLFRTYLELSNP
jgi:RNA polymerase sigma factor (sigma-70 family)